MGFDEINLQNYVSQGKGYIPKEAMTKLNQLLFKEINEYCEICEDDRMVCVLSPMCPRRILLKVRIQSGASKDELPKFCYSQAVNNLKRNLKKLTTLYKPEDELIFNQDFINIMFPKLYKKFVSLINHDNDKLHDLIKNSKVPAQQFDVFHADRQMFRKIINHDKLIREGTFIYDISEDFLLIWFEGEIFISNFSGDSNITICNAKHDVIRDLKIIDIVFHIYCAECDIVGKSILNSPNQITLEMKIPTSQISQKVLKSESNYFQDFIIFMQQFYSKIQISKDSENNIIVSLIYQNVEHFLKRNQLNPLTYYSIRNLTEKINGLRESNKNIEE